MQVFNKLSMTHLTKSDDHDDDALMTRRDYGSDGAAEAESAEIEVAIGAGERGLQEQEPLTTVVSASSAPSTA